MNFQSKKFKARFLILAFVLALNFLHYSRAIATEEYIEIPEIPEESNYIPMQNATVQIMNKQSSKVQTLTIPLNKKVTFDKLEITVKKCLGTNEFLPEDFFMFIEIKKSNNQIFSGWMTRSEPGQNPLQDPDTDLWLVNCDTEIKTDNAI